MLVYAAFVPHNPALLHEMKKKSPFAVGLSALRDRLHAAHADVYCIVSAHTETFPKIFSLASGDVLKTSFKEFGIVHADAEYAIARTQNAEIIQLAKKEGIHCQRVATQTLDHGTALPLHLLKIPAKQKLVVIGTCQRPLYDHVKFGTLCKDVLHGTSARVALIITGDGSRMHSSDSPAGFSPHAKLFDAGLMQSLAQRSVSGLERIQREYPESDACALRPLAFGYGVLRRFPLATRNVVYEVHHGVGLIAATLFEETWV